MKQDVKIYYKRDEGVIVIENVEKTNYTENFIELRTTVDNKIVWDIFALSEIKRYTITFK